MYDDLDIIYRTDAIHVSLAELERKMISIYKFFASEPSSVVKNLPLGLKELIDGLTQLGEPPQVTDSLTQLLTPIFNTLPRSTYHSLSRSQSILSDEGYSYNPL